VANDDERKVEEFRQAFDQELGPFFASAARFDDRTFIELKLPYVPTFAYEERVAGREALKATEADLLRAYEVLAERIARLAPASSRYYGAYVSKTEYRSRLAEDLYSQLEEPDRVLLRQLLTRLVRVGSRGEKPVAAAVRLAPADAERLMPAIEKALRSQLVSRSEESDGSLRLTSAVEDLIEGWPPLRAWLQEDSTFLVWRQRVGDQLADWEEQPDPANLLSGSLLLEARNWLSSRAQDLTPSELEFIAASERAGSARAGDVAAVGGTMDDMLRYAWGEYRAWSATSYLLKRRVRHWGLAVLALTLTGTALGSLSSFVGARSPLLADVMPWAAAVALGLATYFTNQALSESERQTWVKARALSEAIKSECHKYITGAPPYHGGDAAVVLGDKVAELQRIMSGVLAEPVSAEERVKNLPAGRWTIDEYIVKRVREQIDDFYVPAIRRHRLAISRARTTALVLGVIAVGLSASGGATQGITAAVLGVVTTAAASIGAWFQGGRHQQLALSYQGVVSRLELLLAQYRSRREQGTQLVVEAESVFEAEHAAWLAEWQGAGDARNAAASAGPSAGSTPPSDAGAADTSETADTTATATAT
jgi:hypothetical protein